MSDYAKLIGELYLVASQVKSNNRRKLLERAADAIEQLTADLERSKEWEAFWEKEANEALKKFQTTVARMPRWIPVTERLPDTCAPVLVCLHWGMDDNEITVGE